VREDVSACLAEIEWDGDSAAAGALDMDAWLIAVLEAIGFVAGVEFVEFLFTSFFLLLLVIFFVDFVVVVPVVFVVQYHLSNWRGWTFWRVAGCVVSTLNVGLVLDLVVMLDGFTSDAETTRGATDVAGWVDRLDESRCERCGWNLWKRPPLSSFRLLDPPESLG